MELKYFSTFSGIGGFEYGINCSLRQIQQNRDETQEICNNRQTKLSNSDVLAHCVGFSEINKYAIEIYKKHFPGHKNYGDITTINASELPDFDLLVGGFPCQAFSIAGKRKGFEDTRGTLFFDLARILQAKQPGLFIFENVKGLLSHDNGQTFKTIIATLVELGYCVEWQVINSKNHGVPQNRERVFIVGHLGGFGGRKVFPIGENDAILGKEDGSNLGRTQTKVSGTLRASGTIKADQTFIKVADYRYDEGLRIRKKFISPCLTSTHKENGFSAKPLIINPYNSKSLTKISPYQGDKVTQVDSIHPTISAQGGNRLRGIGIQQTDYQIRRLTPTECERLQGFPDGWTEGISDSQRYKCLGNAVTVNVVSEIIKNILYE